MTRWPAYLRIPDFLPVPVRARSDGWTPVRQGEFVGWLAQTGSVAEAATRVGCSRESAYRLRRKAGAEHFAAAWDFAASVGAHDRAQRKFTGTDLPALALGCVLRVRMRRGRYAGCLLVARDSALLRLMARLDRACAPFDAKVWE
jgi:hypothetical protein